MTLTNKIANCKICLDYAKVIGGKNYKDLFQDAWLDVREYEIKHPEKAAQVKNHSSYFYTALHFRNIRNNNKYLKYRKHVKRYLEELEDFEGVGPDYCEAFLYEWVNNRTGEELEDFYKEIIHLVAVCKTKKTAYELAEMPKSKFYEYYKQAEKQLRDDFTRITNNNDHSSNPLFYNGDS